MTPPMVTLSGVVCAPQPVLGMPSRLSQPFPHTLTVPSPSSAYVRRSRAASRMTFPTITELTGEVASTVPPVPSWPEPFSPQHCTPPPATIAHECSLPAATPSPFMITVIGMLDGEVLPLPSWPKAFRPQHFTAEPSSTHVCA